MKSGGKFTCWGETNQRGKARLSAGLKEGKKALPTTCNQRQGRSEYRVYLGNDHIYWYLSYIIIFQASMAQYLYDTFWDERFWFPSNRTHSWKSLENVPGSNVYYPDMKDLHWSLLLGVALIGIRYLLETYVNSAFLSL